MLLLKVEPLSNKSVSQIDLDLVKRFLGAQLRHKWSGAGLSGTVRSVAMRGIGRYRLFVDRAPGRGDIGVFGGVVWP